MICKGVSQATGHFVLLRHSCAVQPSDAVKNRVWNSLALLRHCLSGLVISDQQGIHRYAGIAVLSDDTVASVFPARGCVWEAMQLQGPDLTLSRMESGAVQGRTQWEVVRVL